MLEDSPRMLQNEIEKNLDAPLVAAVELFFVLFRYMLRGVVSGGWDSHNDSGSGNFKALGVPLAILWPQKAPEAAS